ncbi:MAG: 16S rRNA (guanine(527)-N(7))-methyltransferase RsmG [Gammaproteobacteria bacterium]|nr:16S rRNA (guanine(527)-N(7))-methyltransferase RsmG [Gammaproteobacteria bacterium]MDH4255074.1 16S rRNA (guanine(527)-N(7))-methyltransferase RsmG [Gammaproteobacteria bacterium]MDH5309568.1 16S rRNA (guanine(527)-N(7))-methyltransferase RsmG [Gammaproteobacteria bacterium]
MNRAELVAEIEAGAAQLGQSLPGCAAESLATLIEELGRWGRRINLTAVLDPGAMVSLHVLDSLSLRPALHGRRIIDIGTGAGFPGLPFAIAEPGRDFTLLDSSGRKISFVQHMIGMLRLRNVHAVRSRAEDYAPGKGFDTVVARALAALPRLAELAGPLLAEGGVLLAPKGKYPAEELEELPADWTCEVTEVTVPGLEAHARHLLTLRRRGS